MDTTCRGLPTRGLDDSRTGHLTDATSDFACLVVLLLAIFLVYVYLNIYYTNNLVGCIICPHSLITACKTTSTTAGSICETVS